jgi:Fe-S-cluster containining protein
MTSEDPPECLECGACCFSTLDRFVRVTGDDHARLGPRADDLVNFIENRAYMRLVEGHCAALRLDHDPDRFFCSVYDQRPEVCRALARGSPACAGERATKGDRPLLTLRARR